MFFRYSLNASLTTSEMDRASQDTIRIERTRIRLKTKHFKFEQLKLYAEILGLDSHEYLSRRALSTLHRTVIDYERYQTNALTQALKQAILKELQEKMKAVYWTVQCGSPGVINAYA